MVPFYFEAADIVVLPYTAIDHSGIIHLAYSFNRPVISTNVGDFSEVIEDNKSGKILESNTPQVLADTIKSMISNKDLDKMGDYGNNLNKKKYSWEIAAEKTKNVYEILLTDQ